MRRLAPLAALLIPGALAVASLAPVVLIEPTNDVAAYTPRGYEAHSTEFWYPPAAFESVMTLSRFNQESLAITATGPAALVGGSFGGDGWTFTMDFVQLGPGVGDEILSFTDSPSAEPYLLPIRGLRVMLRHNRAGDLTADPVVAVGVQPPFTEIPVTVARHRLAILSSRGQATVRIDGRLVWSGNPGWSSLAGAYPVLRLGPGQHRVSVVPDITISLPGGERADPDAFRHAFVEAALHGQDADGRFAVDNRTDAWTALALVLEQRRANDPRIVAALDRWADSRAAMAVAGRAWPGTDGPDSIRDNVGEPAIPLAMWARDRRREDWLGVVATMIDSAGFTGCAGSGLDWCRLGNLQPDGSIVRGGEPGAATRLADFQFAETAGFVAGSDPESRREWIRALVARTYLHQPCQTVESLGPGKHDTDARPWSPEGRRSHPTVMFLLGLAYRERPTDPIWSESRVHAFLACGMGMLRAQVAGPMGWRSDDLAMDFAIGSQDVAASRLLQPLTGIVLDRERFDVAWERLIDPGTLRARPGRDEPAPTTAARTSIAAALLEAVEP